ncbi:hypothetical protein BH20ACT22_BH20ACT22_01820 [soil metagenome]
MQIRVKKGGYKSAGSRINVDRHVDPSVILQTIKCSRDLLHRFVTAVKRRSKDSDDPDCILVASRYRRTGSEVCLAIRDRYLSRLDIPVTAKLVPADLHVRSHHEIRSFRRSAGHPGPFAPSPDQGETAQHAGLAGTDSGTAGGALYVRCSPQMGQHAHTSHLQLRRLRVLVLIDHVLVGAFHHQAFCLWFHPGGDEGRQVEPRIPVQHQLVVNDLVGGLRRQLAFGQLVSGDFLQFARLHELRPNCSGSGRSPRPADIGEEA